MWRFRETVRVSFHDQSSLLANLAARIASRNAIVGVCGLGYVGLPLASAAAYAGFHTIGFDTDANKISLLNAGQSYIDAVASDVLRNYVERGQFRATVDFALLGDCDIIVICVPTPLTRHREPDMSYVAATGHTIAATLRRGQLVVLESTSYPGTTSGLLKPILEKTGLKSGIDFFLGYSPEREDPGNRNFNTVTIPKLAAGDGMAGAVVVSFYRAIVEQVVEVSSVEVAEAAKITENVFRAVNIALVNELKVVFDAMGIDVWEVIEAAKTKPFGYMPFYPGPGLGGHCIPIDPFYLSWKSREYDVPTRFIELAGEINTAMPRWVVTKLQMALDERQKVTLGASRILIAGLSYKKNVSDTRGSPGLKLIEMLESTGAGIAFHDPHVPEIPITREHAPLAGRRSVSLDPKNVETFNAVLVVTDHDIVDYSMIAKHARLVVDTRNVMARRGLLSSNIVKA